eukprot:symbB.v1.2.019912.t1/scaffold1650.1/size135921/1
MARPRELSPTRELSPSRFRFELKRLFSASSDERRLRNLEGGEGEQDQRQLLVKRRAASNRLSQCKAKIASAAMRMDQLQRRPIGSAVHRDLAVVGRLLLEIAHLLNTTDRAERSARSLTPSPRRRLPESPRFGAMLRETWSPRSAKSLSPRRDPRQTMRVPEETLLLKRAQNLLLWAMSSREAPSAELLEACDLLDVDVPTTLPRPAGSAHGTATPGSALNPLSLFRTWLSYATSTQLHRAACFELRVPPSDLCLS